MKVFSKKSINNFYLLKVMKVGTAHFFADNALMAAVVFFMIPIVAEQCVNVKEKMLRFHILFTLIT